MDQQWMIYAALSATFAALVTIFAKVGLKPDVDSHLATTIRAGIMFAFLVIVILVQKKLSLVHQFDTKDYIFILLAGICGAMSWLFYFLALKTGDATKVAAIDKSSIVLIMLFSIIFLKGKFSWTVASGIALITIGTILTII